MKRRWLEAFTWEVVVAANVALCQAKGALHRPTSDGYEPTRELWEQQHTRLLWLDEAVELCRRSHQLAPFCNFNGNTFAAIARQLTQDLRLTADRAYVVRSWAGHIVAGTATAEEITQFRQLSRSLTPRDHKK